VTFLKVVFHLPKHEQHSNLLSLAKQTPASQPSAQCRHKSQENSLADIRPQFVLLDYKALIYEK
jgi:hypothetical protein